MIETDFQEIEGILGVSLPGQFKVAMLRFEALSVKQQRFQFCLYQTAEEVVQANRYARDFARLGWEWPDKYLIVGESYCGDAFCLDLSGANDGGIWCCDHERGCEFSRIEEINTFVDGEIADALDQFFAVIPVIDVRHGVAVRAARGERSTYRPIVTPLAPTSDPVAVALGYLELFPFRTLYVADLDGIEGRGPNEDLSDRLAAATKCNIWLDNGSSSLTATGPITQVLGSESLAEGLPTGGANSHDWILSLDFRDDELQGLTSILENSRRWPARVMVMALSRVGSGEGPDFRRLAWALACAPSGCSVFAAGGVRHVEDLHKLREMGVSGVLVATALHSGQIKTGDLEEIAGF
jgi:phosphoribosylformimino-5-aminoimidazole carboxamide ribotide isomerase